MESKRFTLNWEEIKKVAHNSLLFAAPALLLALGALQAGKTWEEIQYILYLWAINTATDLLRKFMSQSPK